MFERKQVDYKAGAVEVPSLEVPPDMTTPAAEQRYAIPAADGTQVAKYSDFSREKLNGQAVTEPASPAVVPAAAPEAKLLEVGGIRFVLLNESFDRSWRKVGLALERAGIAVADVDRSKGLYFLKAGDKDKKADGLQLLVREMQGTSLATVEQNAGGNPGEGARVLEALYQNLDKINRGDAVRSAR